MPIDKIRNHALRTHAYRMRDWAMTIGPAMLAGGLFSSILGLSYMGVFGQYDALIHPLEWIASHDTWAVAWTAAGAAMSAVAFAPKSRATTCIFGAWSALMFTWSMSWLISWANGATDRGVAFAALYGLFPIVVAWSAWRGSRAELRIQQPAIRLEGGADDERRGTA